MNGWMGFNQWFVPSVLSNGFRKIEVHGLIQYLVDSTIVFYVPFNALSHFTAFNYSYYPYLLLTIILPSVLYYFLHTITLLIASLRSRPSLVFPNTTKSYPDITVKLTKSNWRCWPDTEFRRYLCRYFSSVCSGERVIEMTMLQRPCPYGPMVS